MAYHYLGKLNTDGTVYYKYDYLFTIGENGYVQHKFDNLTHVIGGVGGLGRPEDVYNMDYEIVNEGLPMELLEGQATPADHLQDDPRALEMLREQGLNRSSFPPGKLRVGPAGMVETNSFLDYMEEQERKRRRS